MHDLQIIRMIVVCLLLDALFGCASAGGSIKGQVIDVDTHEPMEGVHVFALWTGLRYMIFDSQSECFRSEVTQTDAKGEYLFSPWVRPDGISPIMDTSDVEYAYTPGFEEIILPRGQQTPGVLTMKKVPASAENAEARLEYLQYVLGHSGCGDMAARRGQFIPFYRDLYQEALHAVESIPVKVVMPAPEPGPNVIVIGSAGEIQMMRNVKRLDADKKFREIKWSIMLDWGGIEAGYTEYSEEYFRENIEPYLQ